MAKKPLLGWADIALLIGLLAGMALICYPFVSDAWVTYQNNALVKRYAARETAAQKKALAKRYHKYVALNKELEAANEQPGLNRFSAAVADSRTLKAKRDDHKLAGETIAEVAIPKIKTTLPVFAQTSDWLLQFGACRLDGTSYPTGGSGRHAVISAHRGVPNALLFTNLPQLKRGDKFYITIGDHKLAYQVVQKKVIAPDNIAPLRRVAGQDLVTLMTCTPYMVNSQRLLVTGKRVAYTAADQKAAKATEWWRRLKPLLWVISLVLMAWFYCRVARLLIITRRRYRLRLQLAPGAAVTLRIGRFGRRKRQLVADEQGVIDDSLPGGRYRLSAGTARLAYVRRIKDAELTIK